MSTFEHDIEDSVKIYLEFVEGAWRVDPVTVDGHNLDGKEDGVTCDYNHDSEGESAWAECENLIDEANHTPLPDAEEMLTMLGKALLEQGPADNQVVRLQRVAQGAFDCAYGDSNDTEISELRDALEMALGILGVDWSDDDPADRDEESLGDAGGEGHR